MTQRPPRPLRPTADAASGFAPERRTTAVLLAAGAGTRLGCGPKALLPYRGATLVEHLAGELHDAGCDVVVVLGAGASEVKAGVDLTSYQVVTNSQWQSGMGTSLKAGMDAVEPGPNVVVALVDQPGVGAELVRRLIDQHSEGRITAAGYSGANGQLVRGHPVLFDATLARRAAASATGDSGARNFLRAHPDLVDVVNCSDLDSGADVDTEPDLILLSQLPSRQAASSRQATPSCQEK